MENIQIEIRKAQPDEAGFIALMVAMALGSDEQHWLYGVFKELAGREQSQYSYRNTLVAMVDGKTVGAIVGYDGDRLCELREPIFGLIQEYTGSSIDIEDETAAGEFYIDSFAVLPQYRGCGVGRELLVAACNRAFAAGHKKVGLIVDFNNSRAEKLYASLGFKRIEPTTFLGCKMWHMQVEKVLE